MKTVICLYIFLISLDYALLSDATTTEIVIKNEVQNSVEDKQACTCNKSYCVCCEYLNWKLIHVNGLICIKVKYVEDGVSINLLVTYNDTVIIRQNPSLQKLFPICISNNIFGILPGSLCIQVDDIIISSKTVHACFQVKGHWYTVNLPTVNLGCINITKNTINKHYVDNVMKSLMDWYKRKTNNVIL